MTGEDDFTSTTDAAAAFEAERAQNAKHIDAHQHDYANQGSHLACWCGDTVTVEDAS